MDQHIPLIYPIYYQLTMKMVIKIVLLQQHCLTVLIKLQQKMDILQHIQTAAI